MQVNCVPLLWCLILIQNGLGSISRVENEAAVVEISEQIIAAVNSSKIRENLIKLTLHPHMAGTVYDDRLVQWITELWKKQGLDSVEQVSYASLLSYPNLDNPNKVELLNEEYRVIYTASSVETLLRPEDAHDDFVPAFNAYSPNGSVEGELVFANYGTPEDFMDLRNLGVNVSGKIIVCKYGKIYRGNKVQLGEQNGAIGVILYSDPTEYAQGELYPNGMWLSGNGMQRGSIKTVKGDSLTPQYPAIEGAYRIPKESAELPRIPCQPIGYDDALQFLNLTIGQSVPNHWSAVHLTAGRESGQDVDRENRTVRLTVNNYLKVTNVTNVIGIIRGSEQPDRYVLAGNHRDAWGFGAVDASSGTAQMLEVTRVFGEMIKQGWRPKRSIVFCSWGGEEMGLIGSTEWVEDNYVKLSQRAIAYINTDICVSGSRFSPAASPFLHQFLINVTRMVPAPLNNSRTLYDDWRDSLGGAENHGEIDVALPGGGTDHVAFAYFAGIPSMDLTFELDSSKFQIPISMYPAYHSGIDTFHLVDTFIDPGFRYHKSCGQLNGLLLQQIADSNLLPFNVSHYSKFFLDAILDFSNSKMYMDLLRHGVNVDLLINMFRKFDGGANEWQRHLENESMTDPLVLRALNDQLSNLEQCFLLPQGLPFQKSYRHILSALSKYSNLPGSGIFPGLQDLLFSIDKSNWDDEVLKLVEKHVSELIVGLHRATSLLKPNHYI